MAKAMTAMKPKTEKAVSRTLMKAPKTEPAGFYQKMPTPKPGRSHPDDVNSATPRKTGKNS